MYRVFLLILLILSFPFQILIGLFIALTSGLPIVFYQKRVGKNGRPFTMYKFRTMRKGADKKQVSLARLNESDGPTFKIYDDPRFTLIGKFLSRTGLDELPQLWNVLRGEMALIGPRPLPIAEVAKLKPWTKKRHEVLPGIISPAILTGSYHRDFDAWMRSDIAYAETKNPTSDVRLFFQSTIYLLRLMTNEVRRTLHL